MTPEFSRPERVDAIGERERQVAIEADSGERAALAERFGLLAVDALSALAHEGRLSIFRLLVRTGRSGLAAGEIARKLDMLPNTLSANLSVLSGAGLVSSSRDGRSIIYSADYERMTGLLSFLMEDCCNGSPELCQPVIEAVTCNC